MGISLKALLESDDLGGNTKTASANSADLDGMDKLAMALGLFGETKVAEDEKEETEDDKKEEDEKEEEGEAKEASAGSLHSLFFPDSALTEKTATGNDVVVQEAMGAAAYQQFAESFDNFVEKLATEVISGNPHGDGQSNNRLPNNKDGGSDKIDTTPQVTDNVKAKNDAGTVGHFEQKTASAEQVKLAQEMYGAGVDMAAATADEMDKLAAAAADEPADDGLDEHEKNASADFGNIITEGFIDKLAALGEERHGDPDHYFIPYIEEKVAQTGAKATVKKFWDIAKTKGKTLAHKADEAANPVHNFRAARSGSKPMTGASGGKRDMVVNRKAEAAKGVAKTVGLAALPTAGLVAATRKKKED